MRQQQKLVCKTDSDLRDTNVWERKWFVDCKTEKTQLFLTSLDISNNSGAINVKMGISDLGKKPSFKMTGIAFLFWIGLGPARWIIALIIFFSFLTRSMKLLSFEVVLYLYKFIITFRMEYSSLRKKFRIRSYSGPYFPAFFPYSVWMRKNTDQNNSEYELFSRSDYHDCTGAPNY